MTYNYCLGIRVNDIFQERTCEYREHCPYYRNVNVRNAFEHPDEYIELDTYNNEECKYFDESWKKNKQKCETSDMQTDGITILWNKDS